MFGPSPSYELAEILININIISIISIITTFPVFLPFFLPPSSDFVLYGRSQPVFQHTRNTRSVAALIVSTPPSLNSTRSHFLPLRPDNQPRSLPPSTLTACYGVQSSHCYLLNPFPPCATDSHPSSIRQLVLHRFLYQLLRDTFSWVGLDFFLC